MNWWEPNQCEKYKKGDLVMLLEKTSGLSELSKYEVVSTFFNGRYVQITNIITSGVVKAEQLQHL